MTDTLKCNQANCEETAAVRYHWLSQPMFACIKHAEKVRATGAALGVPIHFEPILFEADEP